MKRSNRTVAMSTAVDKTNSNTCTRVERKQRSENRRTEVAWRTEVKRSHPISPTEAGWRTEVKKSHLSNSVKAYLEIKSVLASSSSWCSPSTFS